jgi:hypothetical protein
MKETSLHVHHHNWEREPNSQIPTAVCCEKVGAIRYQGLPSFLSRGSVPIPAPFSSLVSESRSLLNSAARNYGWGEVISRMIYWQPWTFIIFTQYKQLDKLVSYYLKSFGSAD